jgi:hypothetical protein
VSELHNQIVTRLLWSWYQDCLFPVVATSLEQVVSTLL